MASAHRQRLVQGRKGIKTVRGKAPRKGPIPTKHKHWFKPSSKLINIKISIKTDFNIAVALQEIKKFQKSTELLIPFTLFTRLVKEIIYNVSIGRFSYI